MSYMEILHGKINKNTESKCLGISSSQNIYLENDIIIISGCPILMQFGCKFCCIVFVHIDNYRVLAGGDIARDCS